MNHDIAAEIGPAILRPFCFVEAVRIIHAQRQMIEAVRIEGFDPVKALGDLLISFGQLWPQRAARAKDRIGLEILELGAPIRHPHLQRSLLFETDQHDLLRRIGRPDFPEPQRQTLMNGTAKSRNPFRNRFPAFQDLHYTHRHRPDLRMKGD